MIPKFQSTCESSFANSKLEFIHMETNCSISMRNLFDGSPDFIIPVIKRDGF